MICYLSTFDIEHTVQTEFVLTQLKDLVEFSMLNPDSLAQLWIPDFSLSDFLVSQSKNITDPNKQMSYIKENWIFLLIPVLFLVLVIIGIIGLYLKGIDKLKTKIY